jgi:hypothetical protein
VCSFPCRVKIAILTTLGDSYSSLGVIKKAKRVRSYATTLPLEKRKRMWKQSSIIKAGIRLCLELFINHLIGGVSRWGWLKL